MIFYLAYSTSGNSPYTMASLAEHGRKVDMLYSFYYLELSQRALAPQVSRLMMLDSGAYSAWKSGKEIDMDALIKETLDKKWFESVALDDINDYERSRTNAYAMRAAGSPAYPVFHYGEPWELLDDYCETWPKIGLSCRFGEPKGLSIRWYRECFKRRWPHRFHSFGWTEESMLLELPFESADSTTWSTRSQVWGHWKSYGGKNLGLRDHTVVVTAEIDAYEAMNRKITQRWRRHPDVIKHFVKEAR